MTITTYAVGARASARYSATVNGSALPLWGYSEDTQFGTPYWSAGQVVEQSFATLATDETVTVVVSRTSASITSGKVYTNAPGGAIIASTVSGGTLSFSLPPDTVAWCEIDGVRGQPLIISSRPLVTQPTGGTVDIYNGTQTSTTVGRTLVFPPGVHTIGNSFVVKSGSNLWIHGEAWVIGSLRIEDSTGGIAVGGHGVLSGEWGAAQKAFIRTLPFETAVYYSLIWGPSVVLNDVVVSGITLLDSPWYTSFYGVNSYDRVTVIAPWWGNQNAFFTAQKWPNLTANYNKCAAFVHDDVFDLAEYLGPRTVTDNIAGSIASATFIVSYWPGRNSGTRHTATNNTLVCLNYAIANGGSIILAWCDGGSTAGANDTATDESFHVVSGITWDGLRFVGSAINGRPFDIRNRLYPIEWGGPVGTAVGQIRDLVIRNVTFEVVPTFRSELKGKDSVNTPHDIWFENVTIGGTALTAANFDNYFDRNEFPFNVYVDGVPVVDVWTTTGSWYASSPIVEPWSYLPATGRLGGARVLQLPGSAAWAGTTTPSRGALPSIGSYYWGPSSTGTAASLSQSVVVALSASATVSSTAAMNQTVSVGLQAAAGPIAVAQVDQTLTVTTTSVAAPTAVVSYSGTVDLSLAAAATVSTVAQIDQSIEVALSAEGGPVIDAQASSAVDVVTAAEAETLAEAQVDQSIAINLDAAAESVPVGETYAGLSAIVDVTTTAEATVEVVAQVDQTIDDELQAEAEALIDAQNDQPVEVYGASAADPVTWPTITAAYSGTVDVLSEAAAEVSSTAAVEQSVEVYTDSIAELFGVYNATTGDLVAIRSALVALLGRSPATTGATIAYDAEPAGAPWPATSTIILVSMLPTARKFLGGDGERMIQQDGRLQLQVLFPRQTGVLSQVVRMLAIRSRYPEQTVVASVGVSLTGDAQVRRIGDQNGRIRWDVVIPWRSVRVETTAATEATASELPTTEGALEAVRQVWRDRIEGVVPSEGWSGLRTFYDDVGPFDRPPALPWAGVWVDAFGTSSRESSSPTEIVLGQIQVMLHTDQSLGVAGADRIVERITVEHNRTFRGVSIGTATITGARVSPAGTWQTNVRIPFRFERLRG